MIEYAQNSNLQTKRPGLFGGEGSFLVNYAQQPEVKTKRFTLTVFKGRISKSTYHGGFKLEPNPVPFINLEPPENLARRGFEPIEVSDEGMIDSAAPVYITLPQFFRDIYGHWLTDILPDYMVAKGMLPNLDVRLLYCGQIPRYGLDLASVFGVPLNTFVDVDKLAADAVHQIVCTAPIREHDFFHRDLVRQYFAGPAQARLGFPGNRLGGDLLFVSRSKWRAIQFNSRSLINRDVVEAIFQDEGFKIVYPESMTIDEQVSLFSEARIVAGESGSGLHNSVFMPPNGHVICLQSGRQTQLIQAALCDVFSQSCDYVVGQQETAEWSSNHEVELDQVRAAIAAARTAVGL